jgi:hypothetical protein
MRFQLVVELVPTVVVDIEGFRIYAQDPCLSALYREAGVDEQDRVPALYKV